MWGLFRDNIYVINNNIPKENTMEVMTQKVSVRVINTVSLDYKEIRLLAVEKYQQARLSGEQVLDAAPWEESCIRLIGSGICRSQLEAAIWETDPTVVTAEDLKYEVDEFMMWLRWAHIGEDWCEPDEWIMRILEAL